MDPLSFSASLIGIAGLAGTALKASIAFYGFAREIEAASDDIEQFALDIRTFASITQMGHSTLNLYYAKEPTSSVLNYVKELEILVLLAEQSRRMRKRIKRAWRQTESVQSRLKFITRVRWIVRKKEIKALYPDMESLKSSLILVMAYVNWEVAQKRGDSEETRREIVALKQQIKIQLETINLLQQSERRRFETDAHAGSVSDFVHLDHNILDRLVHLGTNIVEHNIVPNPRDYSPSSSTTSVNENDSSSYESPSHSQSSRSSNVRPRSVELSTTATTSPMASPVATVVEIQEFRVPELRQERRRIPPRQKPESSTSSVNPPDARSLVRTEEAISSQTGGDDFISVRATNYLMGLNPCRSLESISGYIDTTNGPISLTVVVNAELDCNVISLAKVRELGLQLETPENEEPVWLQLANGERTKSSGQVVIRWSCGARNSNRPFSVSCLVFEYDIGDVWFGKPFLDKREFYWGAEK